MMPTPENFIPHPVGFYARNTIDVARDLLGCYLVRNIGAKMMAGKIVEVEAYLGESDPACHAAAGKTKRTKIFWGRPGVAYIFLIYGAHYCLNVITMPEGEAGCVLIRALEPLLGVEAMAHWRSAREGSETIANGPGKLCRALSIDLSLNGMDLTSEQSPLYIVSGDVQSPAIETTKRIGVTKAPESLLRYTIKDNRFCSR